MGEMTREEFLKQAVFGAAAITLAAHQGNLTAAEKTWEGDFVAITGRRNGTTYGLAYKLEGDEERDLQGIKWLHRSHELWYDEAEDPIYSDKVWKNES